MNNVTPNFPRFGIPSLAFHNSNGSILIQQQVTSDKF